MKHKIDLHKISNVGPRAVGNSLPAVRFSLDVTLPFLLHCGCLIDEIHCRARFDHPRKIYQAVETAEGNVALARLAPRQTKDTVQQERGEDPDRYSIVLAGIERVQLERISSVHNAETNSNCTYVMSDNTTGGFEQHLAHLGFVTVHRSIGENSNSNRYSVS